MTWAVIWDCSRDAETGASDEMHISKEGDPYLRTLLVQGAQHILGPLGIKHDATLGAEAGGARRKSGKKRAIVAITGEKAGGAAASLVGEWRSVRTIAQQQPNDSYGVTSTE